MEQASQLRGQIDSLPDGVVKDHMSQALAQLESEISLVGGDINMGGPSQDWGTEAQSDKGLKVGMTWEIKVILQGRRDGPQQLILKVS